MLSPNSSFEQLDFAIISCMTLSKISIGLIFDFRNYPFNQTLGKNRKRILKEFKGTVILA